MIDVRVQATDFDPGRQLGRLGELKRAAVSAFVGRLVADDSVEEILVDHHPALARTELQRIAEEAHSRWPLDGIVLIHRQGRIAPNERVMFAGVASSEVDSAGEACSWLVDQIRRRAPFWRKDLMVDGTSRWR